MKKSVFLFAVNFLFIFAVNLQAQPKTGVDYFKGKWNVTVNGPYEAVKMVINFEQTDNKVIGTIKGIDGKEMFKVVSTVISEQKATLNFLGSQGEVDLVLNKKDEDHVSGYLMGSYKAEGERLKEAKK